ncbi:MAG: DUF2779 domain-containing protein, partial [Nitrospinaceae bacterium]|nr:DUF2779 domain-containing protein [Nitrospinaceae bacterium]NIR55335.1 DUF2779 domain-containing protein [Nitrospinaceae bacterium]NIS85774.1 DUF2779 domain-containing protein [Nitrospinaceae bacterium]NIT82624.1 DUF2779 domain-containing protein [Nitrospinaceae bacterium]NIU44829.1 DUF2779 domain-containing protein [Nitrospinaceae bacterium]
QKKIVYRREMKGRYSIKTVLPALVPELNYDSLDIPDGQSASRAYRQLTRMNREEERKTVRNQLLAYCRMDTLGLER